MMLQQLLDPQNKPVSKENKISIIFDLFTLLDSYTGPISEILCIRGNENFMFISPPQAKIFEKKGGL